VLVVELEVPVVVELVLVEELVEVLLLRLVDVDVDFVVVEVLFVRDVEDVEVELVWAVEVEVVEVALL